MCGILACFDPNGHPFDRQVFKRQCRTMTHRGPDDEGYHFAPGVALGMRRLSIIDIAGGKQPISNEDGRISVVLNGEIYNHQRLRRRLEARGHHFATRSDTEVIVHLYEDMGDACVVELDGMFGFALWDARHQRLLVARDRLGIKPIYYTERAGRLTFASEIKAIIEDPATPRAVNRRGLHHYLGRFYVPAPETMFASIYKLPAGHLMVCDRHGHRQRQYWDVPFEPDPSMTLDDSVHAVRSQLRRSVADRMMADVPLGAYLSGGIDSSVIVALMAEISGEPVKTFTLGFGDRHAPFNELHHARAVADHVGTEHHEFVVRENDVAEVLRQAVWYFDEPFGDGLHTYFVSQMAREHVTVALTGLGSDELFGGYGRQARLGLARLFRRAPTRLRDTFEGAVARLPRALRAHPQLVRIQRVITRSAWTELEYYADEILMMDLATRQQVYSTAMNQEYRGQDGNRFLRDALENHLLSRHPARSSAERIAFLELKTTMVEDFLHYADRMGMGHSMELRVPFLDHHLVELAGRIPFAHKVRGRRNSKYVLKKVAETLLPRAIVHRRKQPFFMPLGEWLRNDLHAYARAVLAPDKLAEQGYFNHRGVTALLDEHKRGPADHGWSIWALLVFQAWHDRFIDRDVTAH